MKNKIGWNFPGNNDGEEIGLNDAGVETFKDNPLASLAREICQNSCDAADPERNAPVEVHFSLQKIATAKYPQVDEFKKTLKACAKYWKKSPTVVKFFTYALKVFDLKEIRILKVSDYNTTGLQGPLDDPGSDWFKLTKAVGASDKTGSAGGSFGIGKHAPFACSALRTVLYTTKDKTGGFAFQGVSKLVTHIAAKKVKTQGTGYYGFVAKNSPIEKPSEVPVLFRRGKTGTDIFILGFMRDGAWADEVAKGIIESFFVAIQENKLVAKVEDMLINATSLPTLVTKYSEDANFGAQHYYQAHASDEAVFFSEENFQGLGRIELRVLTGKDLPKKVAMVRSTGMKIFDKGHIQTPSRFAGVFVATGDKLNELLRSMEPPSHNKWEENRYEDNPAYARSVKSALYGWISDCVKSLSPTEEAEQLDAEGVSQYLPDDLDENPPAGDEAAEGPRSEPAVTISVQSRPSKFSAAAPISKSEGTGTDPGEDLQEEEGDEAGGGGGLLGGGGGGDGDGDGGGDTPAGLGGGSGSGGEGDGSDGEGKNKKTGGGAKSGATHKNVPLTRVRVYCSDPTKGVYRVMAEATSAATAFLAIHVVGEDTRDPAPIKSATLVGNGNTPLSVALGKVGPVILPKDVRVSIDVTLKDGLRCALGVSAYES